MILVLRALGVGDLLTAVPALRGIRAAFPGETLALATPSWLTPLVSLIGGVDRIVPVSGLSPVVLPHASLAVNLHGSGPESHRLLQAGSPDRLWAFACAPAGHLDGPAWDDGEHEVRRWGRLLRFHGVVVDDSDISLLSPLSASSGDSRVRSGVSLAQPRVSLAPPGVSLVRTGFSLVHPGAKSPSRRWPVDRFAAVARRLHAWGHRVLITGSESERELAVRVATRAGLDESAVPRTGLGELAGLVAHARVVISGDTGIAHLASAYRTPSVILFGPMSPARWGPPDRPQHHAIWHGTRSEPGDSPRPGVHPALLAVSPDEVLDAVREVTGAPATV
ncbi:glycosyltransferase family 9 protein [Actinoplanes sp. LDG1-06]|uniref:Glycosyltransferase family 9 protein n=1 Tax=Paractinoplanes ovalisporus TaxID=2810368 RepID=A0ABS2ANW6_9ACTN|nr:glycosyltransferase family 9 protein [Actinoplanes ovalisporus]MBM2621475.1 glycosyltransferase family 9 protein [Actinoplanes ovalisporus]